MRLKSLNKKIEKAQQRVIKAAKKWRKNVPSVYPYLVGFDEDRKALAKALDALNKLESK